MGCERGQDNERPVHRVWVDRFGIGRVSRDQSRVQGLCRIDTARSRRGSGCRSDVCAPDLPVVGVTWDRGGRVLRAGWQSRPAESFRLPTEAEWERAARGGLDGALLSLGRSSRRRKGNDRLRFQDWRPGRVGVNAPNGFGLYDMSEGVHEWCSDLLRLQLLSLFARAQSAGRGVGRRGAPRAAAPGAIRSSSPLRRAQLAAAELQICRLWFSRGADDPTVIVFVARDRF